MNAGMSWAILNQVAPPVAAVLDYQVVAVLQVASVPLDLDGRSLQPRLLRRSAR